MDLWKILILGLVILGLVLVLSRPPGLPELPPCEYVETGTFRIVTPAGLREEIFGICPVDAGFRVVSILHVAGKVLLEADFLYSPAWEPLAGTVTQRFPEEVRWLFAFTEKEVVVRRQVGARETQRILSLPRLAFPYDRELFAPWYALLRGASSGEVDLFDVREEAASRISLAQPKEVQLRVLGRALPAQRREAQGEGWSLTLYQQGELLLGARGPNLHVFLREILPEGIEEVP